LGGPSGRQVPEPKLSTHRLVSQLAANVTGTLVRPSQAS
jgi:hypothetical protein